MCSTRRSACAALLVCLLRSRPAVATTAPSPRRTTAAGPPAPLRTLYVQAPLTGPAADEGRAMVDAVRLVVGQAHGLAGEVRVIVRTLDDGGRRPRPIPTAAPPTPRARSPIPARWP